MCKAACQPAGKLVRGIFSIIFILLLTYFKEACNDEDH